MTNLLRSVAVCCWLIKLAFSAQSSADYQRFDNCSFAESLQSSSLAMPTLADCLAQSTASPLTSAVAYCDATKTCNVMTSSNNEILVYLRVKVGWVAYVKDISAQTRIVFKSQAGQSETQTVFGPFAKVDSSPYTTKFTDAVASMNVSTSCNCTYRNDFIDHWNATKVNYQFFASGLPVAQVTFDGKGRSSQAWFAQDNLIGSAPYTLAAMRMRPFYFFQLRFYESGPNYRDFVLYYYRVSCPGDKYYMTTTSELSCCPYGFSPYPRFIYSATLTESNLEAMGLLYADFMVISVNVASRVVMSP